MKQNISSILIGIIILNSCNNSSFNTNTKSINFTWLDSIIKKSDTSYTKPYYRTDFVTATYYINTKDSTTCQIMKDSTTNIRQIIVANKNTRTHFSQYYKNGQIISKVNMDSLGQYDGEAINYFENGKMESKGNYKNGIKTGKWISYNQNGDVTNTEQF